MPPKSSKPRKTRGSANASALLDPEAEIRVQQSTTDVQLLNLSNDLRRRIRTHADVIPTATRPLNVHLFDFPFDEGDPNFPTQTEPVIDTSFDAADTFILPLEDMPDLVVKESRRNQRWLNSVGTSLSFTSLQMLMDALHTPRMHPFSPG